MEYQFDRFDRFDREPGCLTKLANRAIPIILVIIILVIADFVATAGAPWLTELLTEMGILR